MICKQSSTESFGSWLKYITDLIITNDNNKLLLHSIENTNSENKLLNRSKDINFGRHNFFYLKHGEENTTDSASDNKEVLRLKYRRKSITRCLKGQHKICKKTCKRAMTAVCEDFVCTKYMKRTIRRKCRKGCKEEFDY